MRIAETTSVVSPAVILASDLPLVVATPFCALPAGLDWRQKLARLEASMRAGPQVDLPVRHHFSRGVYARELFIPKGAVIVGKIHKYSQVNIVSKGDISVLTEDGVKRFQCGAHIVSQPGIKRAGYAHEDTIWTTIHGTHETDTDALEEELIAASFEEYDQFCAALALEN